LIKETNNLATSESWHKIKAAYEQFNSGTVNGVKTESLSQSEYRWRTSSYCNQHRGAP